MTADHMTEGHEDQHPPRRGIEIVVVDDDPAIGEELVDFVTHKFLSGPGEAVRLFNDPRSAHQHIQKADHPVLVISDITMPGGSGLDLVHALKSAEHEDCPIEALIISGNAGMQEATRAIQVGASDFLLKPIDLNDLKRAVGLALSRLRDRWERQQALTQVMKGLASLSGHGKDLGKEITSEQTPQKASPNDPVAARTATGVSLRVIERAGSLNGVAPMEDNYGTLAMVKLLQSIRRVRNKFFPGCAQGDPAWEILLYVLEQDLLGRPVSVTSACHATLIPQTTAMRKLDELVAEGLLDRVPDDLDRRRVLLSPSEEARANARHFLAHVLEQADKTMNGDNAQAAE